MRHIAEASAALTPVSARIQDRLAECSFDLPTTPGTPGFSLGSERPPLPGHVPHGLPGLSSSARGLSRVVAVETWRSLAGHSLLFNGHL